MDIINGIDIINTNYSRKTFVLFKIITIIYYC